jgi:trimeric autotransporter adhesin
MTTRFADKFVALALLALLTGSQLSTAQAQGTAFTYQGRLNSGGSPANGLYDFQFALSDAPSGGSQVGSTLTDLAVGVTNGLFAVPLDFGANFSGASRWLAIDVRTNGAGGFTALSPLQELTPTPYAIYTSNAGSAETATTAATAASANSVAAANVTGTFEVGQLPSAVVTNEETDVTLGGTFTGNGSGLTQLNASQLLTGTVPNNVLSGFQGPGYSTIGGGVGNVSDGGYTTVGGGYYNSAGGAFNTVAGGYNNNASGPNDTIGGGIYNTATAQGATVAGGSVNTASGPGSFIGGGGFDGSSFSGNTAFGGAATVAGGFGNMAVNTYATVCGGFSNNAAGIFSFAAGNCAQALYQGDFVWADSQGSDFYSTGSDQFDVRAQGGVNFQAAGGIVMNVSGSSGLHPAACQISSTSGNGVGVYVVEDSSDATSVFVNTGAGDIIKGFSGGSGGNLVFEVVNSGTVYANGVALTSDRNAKENFTPLDSQSVLARVASLPMTEWNYKSDKKSVRHIGPMAQDFQAAFRLDGGDDKHISVVDEGGVALAAIQGLNQKLEETQQAEKAKDAEIQDLKQTVAELKKMVQSLAAQK